VRVKRGVLRRQLTHARSRVVVVVVAQGLRVAFAAAASKRDSSCATAHVTKILRVRFQLLVIGALRRRVSAPRWRVVTRSRSEIR
jgi:hypothetical protein